MDGKSLREDVKGGEFWRRQVEDFSITGGLRNLVRYQVRNLSTLTSESVLKLGWGGTVRLGSLGRGLD